MELISKIESSKNIVKKWKEVYKELVLFEYFDRVYTEDNNIKKILTKLVEYDDFEALTIGELKVLDIAINIYESIVEMQMLLMENECPNHFIGREDNAKNMEMDNCWKQYANGEFTQDILTYIPDEVETGYNYDDIEETTGIKMVNLKHAPVCKMESREIAGVFPKTALISAQNNIKDRMDQNSRRRANGSDAFNGRYGQ